MIGENIKKFRKEKKIRQIDLANKLNVTEGVISLWEHNLRTPDVYVVKKIANILGVSMAELLDEEKEQKIISVKSDLTEEQQILIEKIKVLDSMQCKQVNTFVDKIIALDEEQEQMVKILIAEKYKNKNSN